MKCITLLFVAIAAHFIVQGIELDPPTLTMTDSYGPVNPGADKLFGEEVVFRCSFNELPSSASDFYVVNLRTQNSDDSWHPEAQCQFNAAGAAPFEPDNANLQVPESAISCDPNRQFAAFTVSIPLSKRINYDCDVWYINEDQHFTSSAIILKSHSQPEVPQISPDPIMVEEGNPLDIRCNSSAHPAPKLSLQFRGLTKERSPDAVVTDSSPLIQESVVEWKAATFSRTDNQEKLFCKVDSHPYGEMTQTEMTVYVIYGPDVNQDEEPTVNYSKNSDEPLILDGTMASYPPLSYEWFEGGTKVGRGATYQVDVSSINSFPTTMTFKVEGVNPESSVKSEKTYTVFVNKPIESTSSTTDDMPGSTGQSDGGGTTDLGDKTGLPNWAIAVIVVVCVIVVAIAIGATVFIVKNRQNNSSSAMKSKAAQARRPSDERNDTSKYQSSTASLARQDMAGRGAAYHENPTLPMEYRYSQGNVEQYAERIDDMPGSRKPIAIEDMDMFDANPGPPMFEEAPPAYADMNPYRVDPNYTNYSPANYGASYGAAC